MSPLSLLPVETILQVEQFNREHVRQWRSNHCTRLSKDLTLIFILSVAMCATALYIEKPRAFKFIFFGTLGISTLLTVYRLSVMYFKKHQVWPGPPPPRPIPVHQGLADLDSPEPRILSSPYSVLSRTSKRLNALQQSSESLENFVIRTPESIDDSLGPMDLPDPPLALSESTPPTYRSPPSDGSPPMGPGRVGSWESVSSTDSIVKDAMNDLSNRTDTNDLIKNFLTPQQPL